jgi:uncharacterized phage-associated protein
MPANQKCHNKARQLMNMAIQEQPWIYITVDFHYRTEPFFYTISAAGMWIQVKINKILYRANVNKLSWGRQKLIL